MGVLTADQKKSIAQLCREYDVEALDLFGSAVTGRFDVSNSDFDFIVAFKRPRHLDPVDQYFGFSEALERVLGRKVDLTDVRAMRNPYFMVAALKHREHIYAA